MHPPREQRGVHPYAAAVLRTLTVPAVTDVPPPPPGTLQSAGHSSALPMNPLREQDRLLPVANIAQIMAEHSRPGAKVSKSAKLFMQEAVSEFIGFVTSEANDVCIRKKKKAISSEEVFEALENLDLGFMVSIIKLEQKARSAQAARLLPPPPAAAPRFDLPLFVPGPLAPPPLAVPSLAIPLLASLSPKLSLDLGSASTPRLPHTSTTFDVNIDDETPDESPSIEQFDEIGISAPQLELPKTPAISFPGRARSGTPRETMAPTLVGSHWLPAFSFF